MGDYTSIAEVGETLIDLLRDNLDSRVRDSIVLISPGEIETGDNIRLSLFLYQITENTYLKNQEMQANDPFDPTRLRLPPLNLDLYYVLTSYPSNTIQDKTERAKEEHSLLGRAIQILNDNSILKGSALRGSLAECNEELHLNIAPISLDDITRIWSTFQNKPYRPSVCYLVTPVKVESTRQKEDKRVTERKLEKSLIR
ncbi:DUF4255 domain-containing protein [Methanolobus sediminis]|uniref:DUF4255 domain-containing protein n=1 Tax=Methanolobus sediminis TaxID=3072978 RepID=A0AA51UMM1_9EURY|nr:DUF4255 domain-containing protein [Methanolobus sediminis]WMW25096.1 DUF4255 domain-containing protein [Methanolobus sediminis]